MLSLILLLALITNSFAANYYSDDHPFASKKNAMRYETFLKETRCIVCQNQNLMDSSAPLANDLREKIYQLIQQNKSDQEIKNFLTKRYGQFILLRPQMTKQNFILWIFPLASLLSGLFILAYITNKKASYAIMNKNIQTRRES